MVTWQQIAQGEPNPFDIVTTSTDGYSANYDEYVITDQPTVSLPSPKANAAVGIRGYEQQITVSTPSGSIIDFGTSAYYQGPEPLIFVSDGTDWYVQNDEQQISLAIPDSGDLQACYDATKLALSDGNTVSTWPDETGNGHDLTAGTASTYQTGVINGNPAVRFDGVDDYLDVSFASMTAPYDLFIVATHPGAGSGNFERAIDSESNAQGIFGTTDTNDWEIYRGAGGVRGGTPDTNPHIFSVFWDSTDVLRVDGGQVLSGDAGSSVYDGLTVGAQGDVSDFGEFDIGEILLYDVQLSSTSRSEVESYLSNKWGITI